MTIEIKGLDKVRKLTAKLPQELTKEMMKVSMQFMRNVQKSAKLRAPRDTGFLASQLIIRKKAKIIILSTGEAYYAYYQEFGFTPHIIPKGYFQQHGMAPSIPGQFISRPSGYAFVGRSKPFMIPAMEINIAKLPNLLNKSSKKAIDKARK